MACVALTKTEAQVQAGVLFGGGYFSPEARSGYDHEEGICPEFGITLGTTAGRSCLGLAVIHSTRTSTDRAQDPSYTVEEEELRTRSVTAGFFALLPITGRDKRVAVLAGPAVDLVFPYRSDVRRSYTDSPDQEESDAYVNTTPPGLKAGLRLRAEWRFDVQWTPFVELGSNYTLRQSFAESQDGPGSTVTPPTDQLDHHLWLGLSIRISGEDCDCPAFH